MSREEVLGRLRALIGLEDAEADARTRAALADRSPRALEQEGILLRRAEIAEERPALFGRSELILVEDRSRPGHFGPFTARPGAVLRIVDTDLTGVVVRRSRARLAVIFDSLPELGSHVDLVLCPDLVTSERLRRGLDRALGLKGRPATVAEVFLGLRPPRAPGESTLVPLDAALNEDQLAAVKLGVFAQDLALVHGPPGTGKTRTVVEIVRQCVARNERVLAATASNAAIDHLTLELVAADPSLAVVRVGHPARVHPELEAHTLAGLTAEHPQRQVARRIVEEAIQVQRSAYRRTDRSGQGWARRREVLGEASKLFAEARRLERTASRDVIDSSQVIAGTLTGFEQDLPDELRFDVAVVDEASQALTPAVLLAVLRADRLVLAGDHRQLPPTVISLEARELARTAFDRHMAARDAAGCRHMLSVQHRMSEEIMRFPSDTFYEGALVAHGSVRAHRLEGEGTWLELDRALDLIDTAGAGFDELSDEQGTSRENPGQAELTARVARALMDLGASVGVITPYASQVARLGSLLGDLLERGLEIDSVDGFQGREKDAIVFDAVRSNAHGEVGFLADHRRLNVALTRARKKLVVIADSATLSSDPVWAAFFDHAMASGGYRSVFELPAP